MFEGDECVGVFAWLCVSLGGVGHILYQTMISIVREEARPLPRWPHALLCSVLGQARALGLTVWSLTDRPLRLS